MTNTKLMKQTEKGMNKQGDKIRKSTSKGIDAMVRKAMKQKF